MLDQSARPRTGRELPPTGTGTGRAGCRGRERGIGRGGRLTSRPVCRCLGDVRTAWGFIGLDELDPKVVEKGFAVAGQAKGHGEAAVRWGLAVDDDPGEARDRVGSAILELLATQRVADDDAAHARR